MHYLTKEWYQLAKMTEEHFALAELQDAAVKSEALFETLYKHAEKTAVEWARRVYDSDPRDLFIEPEYEVGNDQASSRRKKRKRAREDEEPISWGELAFIFELVREFDERPPFDAEAERNKFAEQYKQKLETILHELPPEILARIADPRVYALGYSTQEVYFLVKKWSDENRRIVSETKEAMQAAMRNQAIPRTLRRQFNLRNCRITQQRWEGVGAAALAKDASSTPGTKKLVHNLILELDCSDAEERVDRVIFRDAEILTDEGVVGLDWLRDELYRTENGYEVHILCGESPLAELILRCRDIEIFSLSETEGF